VLRVVKKSNPDEVLAMKILKKFKHNKRAEEAYHRFRNEVEFLKKKKRKGILNIIDNYLPDGVQGTPWYTMPIATPILKHIRRTNPNVEEKVKLFIKFSETLMNLSEEKIFHRDIKPQNLFWYDNEAVISDFGLVSTPDNVHLTDKANKLGPIFYIAPEMLNDPVNADLTKVDVYSLAKCLWVILTGQNFPLPGAHELSFKPILLKVLIREEKIYYLDNLIYHSTKIDPTERIGLLEFNKELLNWLELRKEKKGAIPSMRSIAEDLMHELQPAKDAIELKRKLVKDADDVLARLRLIIEMAVQAIVHKGELKDLLRPYSNAVIIENNSIVPDPNEMLERKGYTYVLNLREKGIAFWTGGGYEILKSGKINIALGSKLRIGNVYNPQIWSSNHAGLMNSSYFENGMSKLIKQYLEKMPESINYLLEALKKK
jgi:serine/threonine protein kinase